MILVPFHLPLSSISLPIRAKSLALLLKQQKAFSFPLSLSVLHKAGCSAPKSFQSFSEA